MKAKRRQRRERRWLPVDPSETVDRNHLVAAVGPDERLSLELGVEEQRQAGAVRVHDVRRLDQRETPQRAWGPLDAERKSIGERSVGDRFGDDNARVTRAGDPFRQDSETDSKPPRAGRIPSNTARRSSANAPQ